MCLTSNNSDIFFYYYLLLNGTNFYKFSYFPTHGTTNKIKKTCFIIFLTYIQRLPCPLLKNSALHSFWSALSPAGSPAPQTQSFLWFYFSFVLCKLWCNLYSKKSVKWIFCTLQFGETKSIQRDWKIPWRPIFTKHGTHTGALLKIHNKSLIANKSRGLRAAATVGVMLILTVESCFFTRLTAS